VSDFLPLETFLINKDFAKMYLRENHPEKRKKIIERTPTVLGVYGTL